MLTVGGEGMYFNLCSIFQREEIKVLFCCGFGIILEVKSKRVCYDLRIHCLTDNMFSL